MALLKRKRKGTINSEVKVEDVYVITSHIISSYNDGRGFGPRYVTMHFLAKCHDNEYYELFSGKKLEKEKQPENGFVSLKFDTPYIKKVEPFNIYLKKANIHKIDIQSLFDFITDMNVMTHLDAFSNECTEEGKPSSNKC